ncbi:MAG: hypothetical protein AB2705_22980, partial [Candidatus Thiodiazotropha sp.]
MLKQNFVHVHGIEVDKLLFGHCMPVGLLILDLPQTRWHKLFVRTGESKQSKLAGPGAKWLKCGGKPGDIEFDPLSCPTDFCDK